MKAFTLTCLDTPDTDRGVGLALVLETPHGKTWLYDTGSGYPAGKGWEGDFNAGRDRIAPYLQERGIRTLDGVIVSHAHYDHFGGLLWLVDNIEIDAIIDTGYNFSGISDANYTREIADYVELRERFRLGGGGYRAAVAGDMLQLDDDLSVEVIAPPKEFFGETRPENRPASDPAAHYLLNLNSLMLRITHGNVVFLLPGDIEKDDQVTHLLPFVPQEKLRCDVLVAPGHGLHSAPEFAEATHPTTTVVSLFPRWCEGGCTARKVFAAVGSNVYVTGLHGRISVTSDGARHAITTPYTRGGDRP